MPRAVDYQLSDDEDNICDDQEEGEHSEVDVLHKPPEGPVKIRCIQPFLWRPGRVITLCIQTQLAKKCSHMYNVRPDMSSPTLLHFQLLRSSSDDLKHNSSRDCSIIHWMRLLTCRYQTERDAPAQAEDPRGTPECHISSASSREPNHSLYPQRF